MDDPAFMAGLDGIEPDPLPPPLTRDAGLVAGMDDLERGLAPSLPITAQARFPRDRGTTPPPVRQIRHAASGGAAETDPWGAARAVVLGGALVVLMLAVVAAASLVLHGRISLL